MDASGCAGLVCSHVGVPPRSGSKSDGVFHLLNKRLLFLIVGVLALGGAVWLLVFDTKVTGWAPPAQDEAMGQTAIIETDDPGARIDDENRGKTTTDMSQ
jgi:hypothetical protein